LFLPLPIAAEKPSIYARLRAEEPAEAARNEEEEQQQSAK
jgi:hypothetical protein